LLGADLAPGQTVRVDTADGRLTFEVESPAPAVAS
jgi:ATP-dependent Clp protease ATP-binding subunit ClpC